MNAAEYWNAYLKDTGKSPDDAVFSGELTFADSGLVGVEQLALVLSGKKTAMFSAFEAYAINREPLPLAGEVYIVEDAEGNPRCIVEVTSVQVLPFCDVTWEMARQEGEDESLEVWRDRQRDYLSEEGDISGFTFTESTRLVFEVFQVIYRQSV